MSRECTVCIHLSRLAIEQAIISGKPLAQISRDFSVTTGPLYKHRDSHMGYITFNTEITRRDKEEEITFTLVSELLTIRKEVTDMVAMARERANLGGRMQSWIDSVGRWMEWWDRFYRLTGESGSAGDAAPVIDYGALLANPEARELISKLQQMAPTTLPPG